MYDSWVYITEPIGNNEFHYDERITLWSVGKIFVPDMIKWSLDDLKEGSEIVFEEIENGKLKSCTGLKHFIQTDYHRIPLFIIDNHNHALTFRNECHLSVSSLERIVVLHIDQHADTKPNDNRWPITDIEYFVNTKTNVGNFITTALDNRIIDDVIQIRTGYTLQRLSVSSFDRLVVIVDIDIDFREGKSDEEVASDFIIVKKLMQQAKLITIATSPHFFDQKKAITLIKQLLE